MKTKTAILTLVFCLSALPALAGWIITEKTAEGERQMFIQDNVIRMKDGRMEMILDLKTNRLTFLNPAHRQYWGGTPEELSAQRKKGMEKARKMMEAKLSQVPEAQREAYRRQIEQHFQEPAAIPKADVKIKATEKKARIAGYDSRKYEIYVNGKLHRDIWLANNLNFGKDLDIDRLIALKEAMSKGLGAMDPTLSHPEVLQMAKKGWSMKNVEHDGDKKNVEEVIKVEKKKLPASDFTIPQDYKKIDPNKAF